MIKIKNYKAIKYLVYFIKRKMFEPINKLAEVTNAIIGSERQYRSSHKINNIINRTSAELS